MHGSETVVIMYHASLSKLAFTLYQKTLVPYLRNVLTKDMSFLLYTTRESADIAICVCDWEWPVPTSSPYWSWGSVLLQVYMCITEAIEIATFM